MLSRRVPKPSIFVDMRVYLRWAAVSWFAVFLIGQWAFAIYIVLHYWRAAFFGQFDRWNMVGPELYVKGASFRTAIFGLHAMFAAVVSIIGPLQLITGLRRYAPRFHRVCGRIYVCFAFGIALDGLVLIWRGNATGDMLSHVIISVNALIILICAVFTIRTAIERNIPAHNQWAVHLLLAMSGVWFFRVFLMLWLTIFGRPVGFDAGSFTGPFLTVLGLLVYIFPQAVAWGYFHARTSQSVGRQVGFSSLLMLIAGGMAVGLFSAILGMWLPRITH